MRAADLGILLGITAGLKKQREIPEGSLGHLGSGPSAEKGVVKSLHPERRKRAVQVGPHPVQAASSLPDPSVPGSSC